VTDHPSIAGIPLVLGGNVFGFTADEDASFAILDRFYEAGGRMVDELCDEQLARLTVAGTD
jgi:hypothetical protein